MPLLLVVEPSEPLRIAIAAYAKEHFGWETIAVDDGQKASSTIRDRADIDVVVLELALPSIDGFTVIETIRDVSKRRGKHPRIIVFTSMGDAASRRAAFERGCDELVAKESDDVYSALRAHALRSAAQ